MKKLHLFLLWSFLLIGLSGCLLQPISTSTALPDIPTASSSPVKASPSISPSSTPTSTSTLTPTSVPPTIHPPTLTPTPTVLISSTLITKCLEILPVLPEDAGLTGQIFLEGRYIVGKGFSGPDSKLDARTRTIAPITLPENTWQAVYQVSPNGQRLAYWKSKLDANGKRIALWLVVEDAAGNILVDAPRNVDDWDSFYWLDNERIVLGDYGTPYVLNPFTGDWYGLDWYSKSPGGMNIMRVWDTNGVYDSRLSRIFYIQDDGTLLLWDLDAEKTLATIRPKVDYSVFPPGGQPKWTRDDSQLIYSHDVSASSKVVKELFSISRDGRITQLTDLGKYYPEVMISEFSWSPDGQSVAFVFKDISQKDNPQQLAILDVKTLKVTNYCGLVGQMYVPEKPIWSPDGKQLIVGRMEADGEIYSTILVDLVRGYAARLADDLVPVGWMVAP